jgi:hypothetical protein
MEGQMQMERSPVWVRLGAGVAGVVLALSGFLPWSEAGGESTAGWDVASGPAALALLAGLVAVAAAATGGRIGFFRPDVSLRGAADLLGVASITVLACVVAFDLPGDPASGAFGALASAVGVMAFSGDYRVLRGAPAFPRLSSGVDEPGP